MKVLHRVYLEFPETKLVYRRISRTEMSQRKCIIGICNLFSFYKTKKERASTENIFYCVLLGFMIVTCALFWFSLIKAFKILYWSGQSEKQF